MKTLIDNKEINGSLLLGMHRAFEAGAHRANHRIGKNSMEKESSRCEDGGYKCIHLRPEEFVSALGSVMAHLQIPIERESSTKFLDIGCGVGEKVYLASLFGLNAMGLELRQPLITEGKALFRTMGVDITPWGEPIEHNHFIRGNALRFDYKDFDILYFYCPLCDHKLQCKLETRIAMTAKVGAVVIPYLPHGCFTGGKNHHPEDSYPENFAKNWELIQPANHHRYWIRRA